MGSGCCLCQRCFAINGERRIIVNIAVRPDDSTVPMRRVLIDAQVSHDDHVIAHCCPQVAKRHLNNAVRVICTRANCILFNRNPKQNHSAHAEIAQRNYFRHQRFTGVLNNPGQRHNRLRAAAHLHIDIGKEALKAEAKAWGGLVGLDLEVLREPLAQPWQSHGRTITEDATRIRWTARTPDDALASAHYDEFVVVASLPDQPGTLYWPVTQLCERGRLDWTEVPGPGRSADVLTSPAAVLEVR